MKIGEILARVGAAIPDSRGLLLIGTDGFAVERYRLDDPGLEPLVIELLAIVRKLETLLGEQGSGDPHLVSVQCDAGHYFLARVTKEYILFLAADPEAPAGRCRYELQKAVLDLREQIG